MPLKKVEKRFVPFFKAGKIWGDFSLTTWKLHLSSFQMNCVWKNLKKKLLLKLSENYFSAQVLPHSFSN